MEIALIITNIIAICIIIYLVLCIISANETISEYMDNIEKKLDYIQSKMISSEKKMIVNKTQKQAKLKTFKSGSTNIPNNNKSHSKAKIDTNTTI